MKKLIIGAASLGLLISSSFAQGYFNFDNTANYGASSLLPTIGGGGGGFGEGNVGQVIGSDPTFATPNYDITYFWMPGTTYSGSHMDYLTFVGLGAQQGAVASFYAPTGDAIDGAGVFSGGLQTPSATGLPDGTLITIELVAYYDPTGSGALPGHDQYDNFSGNVGWSQLETIRLATTGDGNVADVSSIPGFTLTDPIPEPSFPAFAAVGATALAFVRRGKK